MPGINNVTVAIPATETVGAQLWNPNGYGKQTMYNITATFTPTASTSSTQATPTPVANTAISSTSRRVGFRDVALVTVNDTDPAVVAKGGNGTGRMTMFFRVNGAAVYARGANKVQMDLLDGW